MLNKVWPIWLDKFSKQSAKQQIYLFMLFYHFCVLQFYKMYIKHVKSANPNCIKKHIYNIWLKINKTNKYKQNHSFFKKLQTNVCSADIFWNALFPEPSRVSKTPKKLLNYCKSLRSSNQSNVYMLQHLISNPSRITKHLLTESKPLWNGKL